MPKGFILFGEMRTGSNFLETNLNAFDGLTCHGEAFNPAFIGYPNRKQLLGVTKAERDDDPAVLLDAVANAKGLNGFRFFSDHDPRVLDLCLHDPDWVKIVLIRNPVESYISLQIARKTDVWREKGNSKQEAQKVAFNAEEFQGYLADHQAFQERLLAGLQETGQTAFYLTYEDAQRLDVINGLARWLGLDEQREGLNRSVKKQNPQALTDKVTNPDEMVSALSGFDRFDLTRTPVFEPRRGAMVPGYMAGPNVGLLYQTLRGGPVDAIRGWLEALNGCALDEGLNQKRLRQWMRAHPGHRTFTVIRHPVARAHAAFCDLILPESVPGFEDIRAALIAHQDVPLGADHRAAFKGFLAFLGRNLNSQTNIRVDPAWASQTAIIEGFAKVRAPDMILREDALGTELPALARFVGLDDIVVPQTTDPHVAQLRDVYDEDIEALAHAAYRRDYINFGFGGWRSGDLD